MIFVITADCPSAGAFVLIERSPYVGTRQSTADYGTLFQLREQARRWRVISVDSSIFSDEISQAPDTLISLCGKTRMADNLLIFSLIGNILIEAFRVHVMSNLSGFAGIFYCAIE